MNTENTFLTFLDENGEKFCVSIQDIIEGGVPIDDDGNDMLLYNNKLTQGNGTEVPDNNYDFKVGDEVDVFTSDNHYSFMGEIVKINNESDGSIFYTVKDLDDDFWDISGKDMARCPNQEGN